MTDLWGPAQVLSLGGHSYAHMFEDLSSCEPHVSFLKAKSEVLESYQTYETWVKIHRNPSGIACLGSDRGGEFKLRHCRVLTTCRSQTQGLFTALCTETYPACFPPKDIT